MSQEVNPYDVGEVQAPRPPTHLDYIAMDYESLKRRAVRFLVERFPDDYNNFSESDYGMFLLELFAFMGDQISYKVDYSANQVFLDNTTDLDHMMRLAVLQGYTPVAPTAAKAWVAATLEAVQTDDVIIPSGYLVETRGDEGIISFELFPADPIGEPVQDTDIIIPSGSMVNTNIIAIEGETRTETFISDGNPYQRYRTSSSSVIYGSMEVWINNVLWGKADILPLGSEKKYTIRYNSEYTAEISFGDNIYGLIPAAEAEISLKYRIGGGRNGNIVRGALSENGVFGFRNTSGTASVTITNYESASGGTNGEGIEDIRRNIKIYSRTKSSLTSGDEYQSYAESYTSVYHGKVGKASVSLREYGCAANVIDIYILQNDGGQDLIEPSEELKSELLESMDLIKGLTDTLCVKSGEVVEQNISIGVVASRSYIREKAGLEQNLRDRVNQFFQLSNWTFGKELKKSEFLRYLSGIPEITSLDVVFESNASDLDPDPDVVSVANSQIIRQGDIEISFSFE